MLLEEHVFFCLFFHEGTEHFKVIIHQSTYPPPTYPSIHPIHPSIHPPTHRPSQPINTYLTPVSFHGSPFFHTTNCLSLLCIHIIQISIKIQKWIVDCKYIMARLIGITFKEVNMFLLISQAQRILYNWIIESHLLGN